MTHRKMVSAMRPLIAAIVSHGLLSCSFKSSEVVPLRAYPPLPAETSVQFFPATTPSYPWEDVASGEAQCNQRADCFDLLRRDARAVGADIVYGFTERRRGLGENPNLIITATMARRLSGASIENAQDSTPRELITPK
jgi:hypothetical protein